MHIILINIISLLGLFGFILSFYIYSKKKTKKKLICPMRSNCDTVIHSDFSKIFGIPVEVLGMIYYMVIGSSYSFAFITDIWSFQIAIVLLGISMCAVLFSIYLVSIQAFVLRHWCIWCLSSAITSILIAILSYIHFISY
jgi:uncharacterized membrane protein